MTVLPKELKVLLLPAIVTGALEVTAAANVLMALTVRVVLLPLLPRTVLPDTVRALLTATAAFAVTTAAKVDAVFTVRLALLPAVPNTVLPRAVRAALAVMGAVEAKVVTALTVRVWLPEVPRTVLPATLRTEVAVVRLMPPVKVARPALSMVRRSRGCPLLLLLLPAVVVLNTRLPPVLPAASCKTAAQHF